jgi:hypothetical protein
MLLFFFFFFFFFFFLSFVLGPLAYCHQNYSVIMDIHRQLEGLLGRMISPSQGRNLHRTTQTQKRRGQTTTPQVGFEPTTPVFKPAKTFHALGRAAL